MLDSVIEGAVEYTAVSGDRSDLVQVRGIYSNTSGLIESLVRPDETCLLTFPSMLVRPDLRIGCLGIVLLDRVVIVWFKGRFRAKPDSQVIAKDRITGVDWGRQGARGPYLLTIHAGDDTQLALPVDKPEMGDLVKEKILQRSTE